jgi:sulfide dehydrogenase cytochrome subunit
MKRSTVLQAALLTCGLSFSVASLAGVASASVASGAMLAHTCAGCHGTNGVSQGPATPTIAGSDYDYLVASMIEYKRGKRGSTIMTRIAKGYGHTEIKAMARFFADQEYVLADQTYDAAAAKRGKKLHKEYCINCHVEDGATLDEDEDAALLGGQWRPYLTYTCDDYKTDKRGMSKKMRKKYDLMQKEAGDQSIFDLLEFYASQK